MRSFVIKRCNSEFVTDPGGEKIELLTGWIVPQTGSHGFLAHPFSQEDIRVEEILEELGEKGITIRADGFLDSCKYAGIDAVGVVSRLQQERRDRGNEYGLARAFGSVGAKVASHFTAPIAKPASAKSRRFRVVTSLLKSSAKVS